MEPDNALRNCFRCGQAFGQEAKERICLTCRKPNVRGEPTLNPKLSLREKQVVQLVTEAKANKEIAYELHLTEGTIKIYVSNIFKKLNISSRTELVIWALTVKPTLV